DGLAQMPKEKMPQLAANTAAMVTEHFKDQHLNYGEVYTRIINDMYRFHDIALQAEADAQKPEAASPLKNASSPGKRSVQTAQPCEYGYASKIQSAADNPVRLR